MTAARSEGSLSQSRSFRTEDVVQLSVLAFLVYWAVVLVRPFITLAVWSVVITVALYPTYCRIASVLGGDRRRLAALIITAIALAIVVGPAAWLTWGLIDSIQTIAERLSGGRAALPPPPSGLKSWPVIGPSVYDFWTLATVNAQEAAAKVAPQLRSAGGAVLRIGTEAGTGTLKFLAALIIAGFLFPHADQLTEAARTLARRISPTRGSEFIALSGVTIRVVARGVIGISALQAFLAGIGVYAAGIPGVTIITSAVLVLGIIQIGPSLVLLPLIIWSWWYLETSQALLFTLYMVPVNLIDNILRPFVMTRGLKTPVVVVLLGVIGGTLAHGITGLFLGPIVLAVVWELVLAWVAEDDTAHHHSLQADLPASEPSV